MRLCTFEVATPLGALQRIGVQTPGGNILDTNLAYALSLTEQEHHPRAYELANVIVPPDMIQFLVNGKFGCEAINDALAHLGSRVEDVALVGPGGERLVYALDEITLLAPLPRPNSIRDCLAFEEHVKNSSGREPPAAWYEIPIYYKGNPDSVQGTGADVIWPAYTEMLDFELEFAAVIGREGANIPREEAWDYIAGYTVFNDVSARDIQLKEMSCMLGPAKGKDMDGGNIFGPFLVTADEFDPREDNAMIARVNGEEWSRGVTSTMYHDFATIISYISQNETLRVGDIIGSGTVGTGCGLELKRFPQPGALIELQVEGIGVIANRFVKR
ncbi:MAG: fumarylacetoacetate hydrolase family protein [Dehalococcoidia bacterium]|nr:MAG: fumarylacetoacetate hydrolase family protein [Dehalococcoidia bacterium]